MLEQGQGTLLVLLGNGDGTFQSPISTNSGASLAVVAAADLNGDGKADVAGVFNNTLLVFLSKGDGTFAAGVPYNLGTLLPVVFDMVFDDFNGDHKTDVAVFTEGSSAPGQEIVLLGNGDGTFQSTVFTSVGVVAPQSSVVVGDFNGDGKLDLATAEFVGSGNAQVATVVLQLGNGDGTFQTPTAVCTGPYSGFVFGGEGLGLAAADLNGDGKLDLVFVGNLIGIYLGNGDGTFSSAPTYYQPISPTSGDIAFADFNSDGKPDVAVYGEILLGKGNGTFQGPPTVLLPNSVGGAAVGDFDKNGTLDVAAISDPTANSLYILTNDGTGTLTLAHTYTLQQPSYAIATADMNGDGNLDLIVAGADISTELWGYSVLLGNGDGSFQPPVFYAQNVQSAHATTIVLADFNHDGKLDFAIPTYQSVAVLLGKGDGTFGSPVYLYDGGSASIVGADFNGDGKLDIAAAGSFGLAILLGKGDGTFQPAAFPYTTALSGLFTGDLNGDGKADLVSSNGGIRILLGNGNATFTALAPFGTFAIALADVNGDGNLDVITNDPDGSDALNGIYLGNGDGTFDPFEIRIPYSYPPHSGSSIIQASDMNGDGKQDLILESQTAVVVGPPYGSAFVLLNSTVPVPGTKFSPASVTFGAQTVGTSSNPTPVTLTNTGAVALRVTSVTFGGVDASEFKQTNNCTTIEPLASCTITVTFVPTAAGGARANLIVADNAGSGSQQVVVSGTGAAVPDFTIGPASGSSSSATITAGKSATFSLALTPAGSFSGTVNLACSITPAETPAPTCSLPGSANLTGGLATPVTVTVATTAPGSAGTMSSANFPPGARLVTWTLALFASCLLFIGNPRRRPVLSSSIIVLAFIAMVGCGSGGSSSHSTPGTPVGTYTATVKATSGSLSHSTTLTVIVQ